MRSLVFVIGFVLVLGNRPDLDLDLDLELELRIPGG